MNKKLPRLDSDEAAEKFISTADLSEYDLSDMEMVRFEFQPKTERVNMRLPRPLFATESIRHSDGRLLGHRMICCDQEGTWARFIYPTSFSA
jgi:CopG antitoxin of type II toxin-antitoxin system